MVLRLWPVSEALGGLLNEIAGLLPPVFLIREVWKGAWDCHSLTSSTAANAAGLGTTLGKLLIETIDCWKNKNSTSRIPQQSLTSLLVFKSDCWEMLEFIVIVLFAWNTCLHNCLSRQACWTVGFNILINESFPLVHSGSFFSFWATCLRLCPCSALLPSLLSLGANSFYAAAE